MVQIYSSLWIGYETWGHDLKLFVIGCLTLRIHFLICRIECSSWTIVITKKTMIKYCVHFNQWNKYLPRTDLFFCLGKLSECYLRCLRLLAKFHEIIMETWVGPKRKWKLQLGEYSTSKLGLVNPQEIINMTY